MREGEGTLPRDKCTYKVYCKQDLFLEGEVLHRFKALCMNFVLFTILIFDDCYSLLWKGEQIPLPHYEALLCSKVIDSSLYRRFFAPPRSRWMCTHSLTLSACSLVLSIYLSLSLSLSLLLWSRLQDSSQKHLKSNESSSLCQVVYALALNG